MGPRRLLLLILVLVLSSPSAAQRRGSAFEETLAPEFSLVTLEGETLSSENLRGKVVLLDFWATWCKPCVRSIPQLEELYARYAGEGFLMIGISADRSEKKLRDFLEKKKSAWPQYFDGDKSIRRLFGVSGYPTFLLIDADGVLRHKQRGWGSSSIGRLERALQKYVQPPPAKD